MQLHKCISFQRNKGKHLAFLAHKIVGEKKNYPTYVTTTNHIHILISLSKSTKLSKQSLSTEPVLCYGASPMNIIIWIIAG